MTTKLGNNFKVYLASSALSDATLLTGESTSSVNLSSNPVEVSDKSSPWQKYIAGLRGGTADITVYADSSDAQQKSFLSGLKNGTSVLVFIGEMSGTTPAPSNGISFNAIVSSISDTYDNGSAASRSISLQMTGEPTFYPSLS